MNTKIIIKKEKLLKKGLEFYKKVFEKEFFEEISKKIKDKLKIEIVKYPENVNNKCAKKVLLDSKSVGFLDDRTNTIYLKIMDFVNFWVPDEIFIHELFHFIYLNFPRNKIIENMRNPYKKDVLNIIKLAEKVFGEKRPDPEKYEKLTTENELLALYMEFQYLWEKFSKNFKKFFDYLDRLNLVDKYICWVKNKLKKIYFKDCDVKDPYKKVKAIVIYYFWKNKK